MTSVLLGIGSNIEPQKNIKSAIDALRSLDATCQFSNVYEFEPVGFDGANVFNLAAKLQTNLGLNALIDQLKQIELAHGRAAQAKKFTDRSLDIDLLTYGDQCQPSDPCLPRRDIYTYAFVLLPLAQLCPDDIIPGDQQSYMALWQKFNHQQTFTAISEISISEYL